MIHRTALVLCLMGLLIIAMPPLSVVAIPQEGQVSIVFDMSHDQPLSFNNLNFTEPINFFLNHTEFSVRIHTNGNITAANLSRVHMLVVPNPGKNFSAQELTVVSNFVTQGGALFLLSDYQTEERQIGNPLALNQILSSIGEERIRFTTVHSNNETQGDSIIDWANHLVLPFNIKINGTSIAAEGREIFGKGISEVIIAGGSLTVDNTDLVVSQGAPTSEAVTIDNQLIQTQPSWLAGFTIGSARIVLCSSTTMFSDTRCIGTNGSWFQSANNAILWYNIFKWLSRNLILDPTPIMILFVFVALVVGIGLSLYSLRRTRRL